ncbi:MAG: hypothetical protein ACREAO_01165 [Nitrososphaera sp.]|jgi:hypothetical protein
MAAIDEVKALIDKGCKVAKVQPAMFASDAEVNIVIVTVSCPDGSHAVVKAYRDDARQLREFVRSLQL